MLKKYNQGFTLIELLVVIAIIGILSGIVITALSGARNTASDAKVKADMAGFRTAAELYYNDNNPSSYLGLCDADSDNHELVRPYLDTFEGAENCTFSTDHQKYAIQAPLLEDNTWCVDSSGVSGLGTAASGGTCSLTSTP